MIMLWMHPVAAIGLAVGLLILHEAGHVLATWAWGGRFDGLAWSGWGIGVRLTVDTLTPRQQAWTVAAGPFAEWVGVGLVALGWPAGLPLALGIAGVQAFANLIPWGRIPNDGTRLWWAWRGRTVQGGKAS